jgi:hypothetical protein
MIPRVRRTRIPFQGMCASGRAEETSGNRDVLGRRLKTARVK